MTNLTSLNTLNPTLTPTSIFSLFHQSVSLSFVFSLLWFGLPLTPPPSSWLLWSCVTRAPPCSPQPPTSSSKKKIKAELHLETQGKTHAIPTTHQTHGNAAGHLPVHGTHNKNKNKPTISTSWIYHPLSLKSIFKITDLQTSHTSMVITSRINDPRGTKPLLGPGFEIRLERESLGQPWRPWRW
jgi:hypothetical protein